MVQSGIPCFVSCKAQSTAAWSWKTFILIFLSEYIATCLVNTMKVKTHLTLFLFPDTEMIKGTLLVQFYLVYKDCCLRASVAIEGTFWSYLVVLYLSRRNFVTITVWSHCLLKIFLQCLMLKHLLIEKRSWKWCVKTHGFSFSPTDREALSLTQSSSCGNTAVL